MNSQSDIFHRARRVPALAVTLALHLLMVLSWQFARHYPEPERGDAARIQLVNVTPVRPAAPPVAAAAAPAPTARRSPQRAATRAAVAQPVAPRAAAAPAAAAVEDPAEATEQAVFEARPMPSTEDMLRQARKDLAGIDKDLKKEFPGPLIKAPRNTPQVRLEKGIDLAYEMAPPKWYEQAKIKELSVPGSPGTRRYRIITAMGTYCVTYPSNHSLIADVMQQQGLGSRQHTMMPQKSTCPIEF